MPPRSKIQTVLNDEDRKALNARLVKSGFADYSEHAEWLAERGYEIARSSVHRYGQDFEDRLNRLKLATEQARTIVEASPDDEGMMSDALTRLLQEKLFTVLQDMEVDPDKVNIASLGKAIADLNRANISQKKWQQEYREKIQLEERAKAANKAKTLSIKAGLSDEQAGVIRAQILGIDIDE